MAFRYMNIGDGALTGDNTVTTIESFTYNPQNGVSFQKIGKNYYSDETKVTLPQAFTTDIYGKFNLYFDSSSEYCSYFSIGATSTSTALGSHFVQKCLGVQTRSSKVYLTNGSEAMGNGIHLKNNALNKIYFHLHRGVDKNTSYGELTVNGTETFSQGILLSAFSSEKSFSINFVSAGYIGDKIFISDLIISDEYISPREQVVALPIFATDTNMTAGANGLYIANAANQSLLQSVDASALGTLHGANSQVTGVALVGNPAYKTAEGLASFTSLSKAGSVVTEHDTFNLSDDTASVIQSGWALSNTTIADLQNMQFGWKAGE